MHKHIHIGIQNEDGTFFVKRDGIGLACPKTAVLMPMQGVAGMQMTIQKLPCCTNCPFATLEESKVDENETSFTYIIGCEGQGKKIELNEIKMHNKENQSKLVGIKN